MDTTVDKSALALRLQEALDALESGDEAAWRQRIDGLVALRTQPMMSGLSRLARELGQALGELPTVPSEAGELDDACARLDHVVAMTEQATHRTLDLAEECRSLTEQLRAEGLQPVEHRVDPFTLEPFRHHGHTDRQGRSLNTNHCHASIQVDWRPAMPLLKRLNPHRGTNPVPTHHACQGAARRRAARVIQAAGSSGVSSALEVAINACL